MLTCGQADVTGPFFFLNSRTKQMCPAGNESLCKKADIEGSAVATAMID